MTEENDPVDLLNELHHRLVAKLNDARRILQSTEHLTDGNSKALDSIMTSLLEIASLTHQLLDHDVRALVSNPSTQAKMLKLLATVKADIELGEIAIRFGHPLAALGIQAASMRSLELAKQISTTVESTNFGRKGGKNRIFNAQEIGEILALDQDMADQGDDKSHGRGGRLITFAKAKNKTVTASGKVATARQVKELLDRRGAFRKKT
jgi:hypothetical protein